MGCLFGVEMAGGPTCDANEQAFPTGFFTLRHIKREIKESVLTVIQRLDKLEVRFAFEGYADTNAIRVSHIIKNISDADVCLE